MGRKTHWDWLNEKECPVRPLPQPAPESFGEWLPVIIMLAVYALLFCLWTT